MTFAAFTEICEEDQVWIPQYLAEVERLGMPFGIYLDRCSLDTKALFIDHPLRVVWVSQDDPTLEYTEQHKQTVFDALAKTAEFRWLVHWNIDEVWERDAPRKLAWNADRDEDYLMVQWVNCWEDQAHVRIDGQFYYSKRVKFYNVSDGRRWKFDHPITHGCKLVGADGVPQHDSQVKSGHSHLVCLHTGLMTRELRELHKARWDRIYTTAVGNNPYKFWDYCLNEAEYPATVVPNPYR